MRLSTHILQSKFALVNNHTTVSRWIQQVNCLSRRWNRPIPISAGVSSCHHAGQTSCENAATYQSCCV